MKNCCKRLFSVALALVLLFTLVVPQIATPASALSYGGSTSYRSGKYYRQLAAVQLTGNQRTDIVNVAKSQIGYMEGNTPSQLSGTVNGAGSCTEYGRWYGLQDMWCAMFVSWCANVAGVSTSVVPAHAFTPSGLNWFRNRGLAYTRASVAAGRYTPKAGDIVYFKSGRNGNITNHVGIVTSYSGGTLYTIEGNTSSATISTNGGIVAAKAYSISNTYIVYICSPNYKGTGNSTPASSTTVTSATSALAKAAVFNATYYSNKYADLKNAYGTDETKLYNHYLQYGIKEGRQASPTFSVAYYLENNADLKKAFGNDRQKAYNHFLQYGIKEPRPTAPAVDLGTNFYAEITNVNSGMNVSIVTATGNVLTYTKTSSDAQTWKFIRQSDGSYKIVNKKTGKCLDVQSGAYGSGANVQIYNDNGSNAQRWYIHQVSSGKYVLRSKCSPGCVLDVQGASKAANANIQNYSYNGTLAQQFTIKKTDTGIVNLGNDFYAKIGYPNGGLNLSLEGTRVITYNASAAPAQVWHFERQSDGSYKITNMKTGQCMDVAGASSADGTAVQIYDDNDSNAQRWFLYQSGNGYSLHPACAKGSALDVSGASKSSGVKMSIFTANNTVAQIFTITKVDRPSANLGNDFYARIGYPLADLNLSLMGDQVITYGPSEAAAQVWHFVRQEDGTYKIINTKNGKCLDVTGASSANGAAVKIVNDNGSSAQRWYVYETSGGFVLRPACAKGSALDVPGASTSASANMQIYTANGSAAQTFTITKLTPSSSNTNTTDSQMAVIRKIIYAVETGGQVYGQADYTNFTPAYTNSSQEHAITIGAGAWYGTNAQALLKRIRSTDPATFSRLDTAGIGTDLDTQDWSTYKLATGSTKAMCIQTIIGSAVGRAVQDAMVEEMIAGYMAKARALGVTELDAQMMCANIHHHGGYSALKRVLAKTAAPYTLDNIYAALQTDTGNQVGAYRSRQKMVYNALKQYV